ncbi:hypothetical protein IFM89_007110 [Coptis chinensis]|uniref:Flavin-containing monooxygenase n=1 Tax=Coptis chinensis TaxID=261450 RepID=A0A835H3W3_9MAGN|nr:hypothetical protein IFM89_007110 [Coptis chinensis]
MILEENIPSKHVCVIGAGPSGLVAGRELRKEGHTAVILEQNHEVGGQWLYEPNVEGEEPLGKDSIIKVHSSIYASLRLTTPREIIGYTDFPFLEKKGRDMRRYPGHEELLLYLQDFCEWFGLRDMIRFDTRVEYVGMLDFENFGSDKWVVRSRETKRGKVSQEVYDAVVVATGHYSQPRLPNIQGMDTWRRKQMHSHIYRVPQPFVDEVVVVVGNSKSGTDISMEVLHVAKEVHLSAKSLEISEGLTNVIAKYQNLHLHPQIDSLQEDGQVLFVDGTSVNADSIVYCTGYQYSFPFLDTKGMVVVDDGRVGPLYEHTFPPSLAPSLSFVGIPRKVLGLPFFEAQAKWIAQLLARKRTLPSVDDMMRSIREFYNSRDVAGAGPSGLVAARELRKEGHTAVVLEQNNEVGGQWLYEPKVEGEDHLGKDSALKVHSSIYDSLRLTSPREIMGYTDFPFLAKKGRDMRRFPGHKELLCYLKDFCEWFGLREMIRFNTRVEYVGMFDFVKFGRDKWIVRSKDTKSDKKASEEVFDAVVVATGHYSQPRLPNIKGNSLSGTDISMELVDVAKEIHLSAKSLEISEGLSKVISKHQNLHLHPLIDSLCEDGRVLFVDGTWVIADSIIHCTGYSYSFPFLDTKGMVAVDDDRVGPLYEHTFPPSLAPSLSFVGIPRKLIGFPFFEAQAKWIAQALSGKRALPSWDDMMRSIKEFYNSRDDAGIPKHNTHDIANFEYCDRYGEHCGFPHIEDWRKELCLSALRNSESNLETYRDLYDDHELLQEAHQSPHFTQLDREAFVL